MSQTKRRQGKRASTIEEGEGDVKDAMAATSCRSRRPRYAQNIKQQQQRVPEPKCCKQIYVHALAYPLLLLLNVAHPPI